MHKVTYWHTYRQHYMTVLLSLCLLLCALIFSGIAFWYAKAPHSPSGDEPHYLIISQTLVKYHSLDVMQDYTNGDYHIFYPLPISPHVIPGAHGRLLPIHGIGGPILWVVPYALAGWLGAVLFMSAVTLLIVWNIYLLLCELEIEPRSALLVCMAYGLASPLTLYAHLVFIEPIAALLCVCESQSGAEGSDMVRWAAVFSLFGNTSLDSYSLRATRDCALLCLSLQAVSPTKTTQSRLYAGLSPAGGELVCCL